MGVMTGLAELLDGNRVVVEFPDADLPDWMAAAEVCIQEGLAAIALPVGRPDWLSDALMVFGRRARVGVWGVRTGEQAAAAAAAGAHFLTSPVADVLLVEAASGVPVILGAMTPNEIVDAAGLGAAGVQVVPADALGMSYSRSLPRLLPDVPLIATGRLERFQAEMWLQAGADAVCLVGMVLTDEQAAKGSDMDPADVRRRAQSYRTLEI